MNIPYEIKNVAMTGSVIDVKIEAKWNSVVIKMRETDVALEVYNSAGNKYFTVPAGQSFGMSCYNFSAGSSSDYVKIKAASGTAEILGFIREG